MAHFTHYTGTEDRKAYLAFPIKWYEQHSDEATREARRHFKCKSDLIVSQAGYVKGDTLELGGEKTCNVMTLFKEESDG